MAEIKKCKGCLLEKSVEDFYYRKDLCKHSNICKRCQIDGKKIFRVEGMKECKHCHELKSNTEYQKAGSGNWLQPYCKPCDSIRKRGWEAENKETLKGKRSDYYLKTRVLVSNEQKELSKAKVISKLREGAKKYWLVNQMTPEEKKKRKSDCDKRYREINHEKIKAKREEYKNSGKGCEKSKAWQAKMMGNIEFRLKKNLRGRIYVALKKSVKSDTTMNLIGCSIDFFKGYVEAQFTFGMCWDNMGLWHLDHKIPCANFDLTKESQQRFCFNYTNIQPLWAIDNLRKGAKILQSA